MRTKNEERDRKRAIRQAGYQRKAYWDNPEAERRRKREYYRANREKELARTHRYKEEIRRLGGESVRAE